MKKIKATSWKGEEYTQSIAGHVEYRLLHDSESTRYGIERQAERVAELLGIITDKLVQSGAIDFMELDSALSFLDYGEELVDVEEDN